MRLHVTNIGGDQGDKFLNGDVVAACESSSHCPSRLTNDLVNLPGVPERATPIDRSKVRVQGVEHALVVAQPQSGYSTAEDLNKLVGRVGIEVNGLREARLQAWIAHE